MSVYPSDKLFTLLRSIVIILIVAIIMGTVIAFATKTTARTSDRDDAGANTGISYIPPKEYA